MQQGHSQLVLEDRWLLRRVGLYFDLCYRIVEFSNNVTRFSSYWQWHQCKYCFHETISSITTTKYLKVSICSPFSPFIAYIYGWLNLSWKLLPFLWFYWCSQLNRSYCTSPWIQWFPVHNWCGTSPISSSSLAYMVKIQLPSANLHSDV